MKRLNKYISEAGLCSRRQADRLIAGGKVTVDGEKAVPGMQVEEGQEIRVEGVLLSGPEEKIVLAVNKPAGVVCTADPREKENLYRRLGLPRRLDYAGRLDKDSEGLLLLTNDGDLANAVMRARNAHEKEYEVTVDHPVTEAFLDRMRTGVRIRDTEKGLDETTRPCKAWQTGDCMFRIILTQGLNRQIRRMCEALGYRVTRILRVRIMNIKLGSLPSGQTRPLTDTELKELYRMAGLKRAGKIPGREKIQE